MLSRGLYSLDHSELMISTIKYNESNVILASGAYTTLKELSIHSRSFETIGK